MKKSDWPVSIARDRKFVQSSSMFGFFEETSPFQTLSMGSLCDIYPMDFCNKFHPACLVTAFLPSDQCLCRVDTVFFLV